MTFSALLTEDQMRIWTEERTVLQRTLDVLSSWEAAPADLEHLRRALQQLDELFLLVVVGEFNSGKSALINALLGEPLLAGGTDADDRPRLPWPTGRRALPSSSRTTCDGCAIRPRSCGRCASSTHPGRTRSCGDTRPSPATSFPAATWSCSSPPPTDRSPKASEPSWKASASGARRWLSRSTRTTCSTTRPARREVEAFVRSQVRRLLDFEPELFLVSARAGLREPELAGGRRLPAIPGSPARHAFPGSSSGLEVAQPAGRCRQTGV